MSASNNAISDLPGTTRDDIQNVGFNPNKIAVYYDEARTVGPDVKFQPTAFAIQTGDPSSTTMRDLLQGSMRMHQLLSSQYVHLLCTKQGLEAKRKAEKAESKANDPLTFEEFLKWANENQGGKLKSQLIEAYKARVDGTLKGIIFERMRNQGIPDERACEIYGKARSVFQKNTQATAIEIFAADSTIRSSAEEIKIYSETKVQEFKKNCRISFLDPEIKEEIGEISDRLEQAQNEGGTLANVLWEAEQDLGDEKFEVSKHDFDTEVSLKQDQGQQVEIVAEQEREERREQDIDVDIERELDIDLSFARNSASATVRVEVP
jgi:hypothetical protein